MYIYRYHSDGVGEGVKKKGKHNTFFQLCDTFIKNRIYNLMDSAFSILFLLFILFYSIHIQMNKSTIYILGPQDSLKKFYTFFKSTEKGCKHQTTGLFS